MGGSRREAKAGRALNDPQVKASSATAAPPKPSPDPVCMSAGGGTHIRTRGGTLSLACHGLARITVRLGARDEDIYRTNFKNHYDIPINPIEFNLALI